jgi:hypothetical protein
MPPATHLTEQQAIDDYIVDCPWPMLTGMQPTTVENASGKNMDVT